MDFSIIIVSFNTKKLTLDCIESILKNTKGVEYEIIVIDNASRDDSIAAISKLITQNSKLKLTIITNKKNLGFAGANNQGFKASRGKYVLFLNSDTVINDNVLGEMIGWMDKHPQVGVATCTLKGSNGNLQPTGGYFPTLLTVFSWMIIQDIPGVDLLIKPFHPLHAKSFFNQGEYFYKKPKRLDWVTGAFLLTRREVLKEVGGWDESYFMYVEEVDLCYRIKKHGWQIWYLPKWSITHLGGASSKIDEFPLLAEYTGIKKFYKKFYPTWQYPTLRFLLKLGSLGRIVLFGILEGRKGANTYLKAFSEA